MKVLRYALWLAAVVASIAFGGFIGHFFGFQKALDESKVSYNFLKYYDDRLTPQTREYLKDRLYWEIALYIPKSYLIGWDFDFGPVDETALNGIRGRKDASSAAEVYAAALRKLDARMRKSEPNRVPQVTARKFAEPKR